MWGFLFLGRRVDLIMKNTILLFLFIIQIGCVNKESETDKLNKKNPVGSYGQTLSEGETYNVGELLSSTEKNIGKNVLITGLITEVCPMRGCWIEIIDDSSKEKIRIKVADGEIIFPLSAKGKTVIAEGEFAKLELSAKQAKDWKHHLALEKGIVLDTAKIALTKEDFYEYRIYSNSAKIF